MMKEESDCVMCTRLP